MIFNLKQVLTTRKISQAVLDVLRNIQNRHVNLKKMSNKLFFWGIR